jgi:hypothetical protein
VHVLSAGDEATARAAAAAADALGYDVTIDPPAGEEDEWTIRAAADRVVHASTIGAFRASFERIARECGASYDGWEASPTP